MEPYWTEKSCKTLKCHKPSCNKWKSPMDSAQSRFTWWTTLRNSCLEYPIESPISLSLLNVPMAGRGGTTWWLTPFGIADQLPVSPRSSTAHRASHWEWWWSGRKRWGPSVPLSLTQPRRYHNYHSPRWCEDLQRPNLDWSLETCITTAWISREWCSAAVRITKVIWFVFGPQQPWNTSDAEPTKKRPPGRRMRCYSSVFL